MAPVKQPTTKPGVTGFYQEYNQEPGPRQDLNPDVVTEDSVLPAPVKTQSVKAPAKTGKAPKAKK